jgi:Ca2+-binding RTX toxin-like protein
VRTGRALRLVACAAALCFVTVSALAATNAVPATNLGRSTAVVGVNELKPAACAGIVLTAIVVGTSGTAANELVLGGAAGETIRADSGNDCVLGGGGNDTLRGEQGTDVCIGGPGTDSFNQCETQIQ